MFSASSYRISRASPLGFDGGAASKAQAPIATTQHRGKPNMIKLTTLKPAAFKLMTFKLIRTVLALAVLLAMLAASPVLAAADDKPDKSKSRHPSYELLGPNPPPTDSILNPNFLLSQESKVLEGSLWHGSYLQELLVALDVGDVDGDRRNEIVYATTGNVYLGRRQGELLEQLAVWKAPSTLRVISVDLYDPARNGRAYIIVSAQGDQGGPSSAILSYEGSNELKTLSAHIPWYLRVVGASGDKILVAQKGANNTYQAYNGSVVQATVSGGKLDTSQKMALPFGVNLFNFNTGPVGIGSSNYIATVTFPDEHLKLFSGPSRSDQITEKNSVYCGTTNYIKFKTTTDTVQNYEYIPSRIVMADIDNAWWDGYEFLVVPYTRSLAFAVTEVVSWNNGIFKAELVTDTHGVDYSEIIVSQADATDEKHAT